MGQIRELMTVKPRTVKAGDSVVEAAKLMKGEDAGVAPIVDGDRLVGIVTDRDIAIRVVAEGRDPQSTKVEEVASQNVVTVDPRQDLDEALRLMATHQLRRLPVVEEDGKLVGIVAQADVARHAGAKQTGEVVEQSSECARFSCGRPLARGRPSDIHCGSRRVRSASRSKPRRVTALGLRAEAAGRLGGRKRHRLGGIFFGPTRGWTSSSPTSSS
jgi:CBS domain-containing protein